MKLYTYYRSQASFRGRHRAEPEGHRAGGQLLHLEKGDQFAAAYRAINPQMVVPTLIDGDIKLFQSLAILEYLEEKYPEPPLLPADPQARRNSPSTQQAGFRVMNPCATSHAT
jgi:glutathione S-transferase